MSGSDSSGGTVIATGSSSAIAVEGPTPGSRPATVPRMTPRRMTSSSVGDVVIVPRALNRSDRVFIRFSPPNTRYSSQPTGSSTFSQTSKTRKRIIPMTSPRTSTQTALSGLSRTPKTSVVVSTEKTAAASANPMRKIDTVNSAKRTMHVSTRTSSMPVTGLVSPFPRSNENRPSAVVPTSTMPTTTGNVLGPIPSSPSTLGNRRALMR